MVNYKRIGYRIESYAIREWPIPSNPMTRHFLDAVEVDMDTGTISTSNVCSGTKDGCIEHMSRIGGRLVDKTDIEKFLKTNVVK